MALGLIFYIKQRLSDIFKYVLWPLYVVKNTCISLFHSFQCHLSDSVYPSPLSGGFTFFELMKRGVPLHLIDKYMNESKTSEKSESEKKGSN